MKKRKETAKKKKTVSKKQKPVQAKKIESASPPSSPPPQEVIILHKTEKKVDIDIPKVIEKLEKMKEEILAKMMMRKAEWRESGAASPEPGDEGDVVSVEREREFETILSSIEKQKLVDIEDAIRKAKEGRYGICEECRTPIQPERLEIVPFARFCRECQEIKDREGQIRRGTEELRPIKSMGFMDTSDEES